MAVIRTRDVTGRPNAPSLFDFFPRAVERVPLPTDLQDELLLAEFREAETAADAGAYRAG